MCMTHDSIGLGEDGPTHQPVEHLAALARHSQSPGVSPGRRGRNRGSLGLRAARSDVSLRCCACRGRRCRCCDRSFAAENPVARGAYVLSEPEGPRDVTLIATGSEVSIAVDARATARRRRHAARPSFRCPASSCSRRSRRDYRAKVLGTRAARRRRGARSKATWRALARRRRRVRRHDAASAPRRRAGDLYRAIRHHAPKAVVEIAERAVVRASSRGAAPERAGNNRRHPE